MNHMYQHIHSDHSGIFKSLPNNFSSCIANYNPLPIAVEDLSVRQNNSLIYACDRCNTKFESLHLLKEHTNKAHWRLSNSAQINEISSQTSTNQQQKPTDLSRKRRADESVEKIENDISKLASPTSAESSYDANEKPCICSYCYAQMPNFKTFLIHMESHVSFNNSNSVNPNNPYSKYCPICGEPGRDSVEFSKHIFAHAITNIAGKCCHHCEKYFDQYEHFQKHLIEAHSQTIYKCSLCSDLFETIGALNVSNF